MPEPTPRATLPTLLTFAPMVDSETSRLLLRHYGVAHVERDHLFGWVSVLTIRHGGFGQVPLLYGSGLRLTGPRAIARRFDAALPPECRLAPTSGPLAPQVAADWTSFNGGLGADAAVFAYYHLLPERGLMTPIFAAPLPADEARLVPRVYPLLRGLFTVLLFLSPARAAAAAGRIRALFDATDRRIADGRTFLCGDRLTLGDVALSGAAAPLIQPRGYGTVMPAVALMPAPLRDLVADLRDRPTATLVQNVYDELPTLPACP